MEGGCVGGMQAGSGLLQWANMLPGAPSPPAAPQLKLEAKFRDVKAGVAGMFKHGPDREDRARKGGIVGTICDLDGTVLQELRAPCDAVVHEMMPKRLVYI